MGILMIRSSRQTTFARTFNGLVGALILSTLLWPLSLNLRGATPSQGRSSNPPIIIAHRGGVVDAKHSENSLSGLEEAIRRGYTHVEVDARCTADGFVVCFHNDSLEDEAGVAGRVSQMPLAELRKIILTRSRQPIPTFAEFSAKCANRIDLMVDLKGCPDDFIEGYATQIETALTENNLLAKALILINKTPVNNQEKIVPHFYGKCRVSWRQNLADTQRAALEAPAFRQRYFIFNHGDDFTAASIKAFQQLGLEVVVSINVQHYPSASAIREGNRHVAEMLGFGVDGLQIDSIYDRALFEPSKTQTR